MPLEITFTGLEARRHHIVANEGLESLAGLAHAATLVAHFVATNSVRQRQPYDERLQFFFQETRPGSLTALLALGGGLAMGAAGNAVYDLLKIVWSKATGSGEDSDAQIGDRIYRSGDIDALTEAASPSLLRGHSWIGHHEQRISIKKGRDLLVDFNQTTKDYLKNEIFEEGQSVQDVSVAALNVNSKHGRVFFFDLGRTIPFRVDRNANGRTIPNLSRYLTQYAERTGATVNIRFKKILFVDGRVKRLLIYDCHGIEEEA
ncbi:conserved hypothetical protein [Sphingomonas aurantiaca]|uniref:Uncharacterized protein n=1 Tax=Sphingomonas aurantiaca TaxID=185949 RepID=A0A5E8A9F5_9SPHN|nr:hypothetical protein [Sphingomonas aurantiaca]VVT27653.1 conserved hypothetical protein [Sphingomonas aurantiaca]